MISVIKGKLSKVTWTCMKIKMFPLLNHKITVITHFILVQFHWSQQGLFLEVQKIT